MKSVLMSTTMLPDSKTVETMGMIVDSPIVVGTGEEKTASTVVATEEEVVGEETEATTEAEDEPAEEATGAEDEPAEESTGAETEATTGAEVSAARAEIDDSDLVHLVQTVMKSVLMSTIMLPDSKTVETTGIMVDSPIVVGTPEEVTASGLIEVEVPTAD
jgi:hypothetical protein